MLKSVEEGRSMPPNANLWSLVGNCTNREDIKLLFQILERLRVFVSPSLSLSLYTHTHTDNKVHVPHPDMCTNTCKDCFS